VSSASLHGMDEAPGTRGSVLRGGGETGALMRAIDWSATAVGPVEGWPQSLRTALGILLETGFPMYIAWGPDFTQFYNDGYRPILGSTKHPAAMGISTRVTFAEIWDIIGPMFMGVMAGTAVTVNDFLLPLDRHGFVEECYFVFSYSPIREESGNVGGVLVTVNETTERVLGARRMLTLRDLAAKTQGAATALAACDVSARVLADGNPADVPGAIVYLLDDELAHATLAGTGGPACDAAYLPASVDLAKDDSPWQLARVCETRQATLVQWPAAAAPAGAAAPPTRAFAQPIFTPGAEKPSGVLVAALSPRLSFDGKYRSFLELVAGHVGSSIASTRALEEAKARAAALAEVDRAKTVFFSNVSHELRTPLTLMLAPIQDMAAMPHGAPIDHAAVELLHRNALRLQKLVNTLLQFARIEAGRVEAAYEPVDLAALTTELASTFRAAIERAGLHYVVHCPPLAEPVWVDRQMWEKIVLNLLSNAFKFTFEGEITVRLRLDGDGAYLDITDTGTGIPERELPRLFERFHRIEGARSRSHEGSGIGLALIHELARLHGGDVRVESHVGRGTTFTVRLPRGAAHLPAGHLVATTRVPRSADAAGAHVSEALRWHVEHESARPSSPPPAPAGDPRKRIVFADDNADMRDYVGRLLGERWPVEAVGDGAAALASIRRTPPALVLCDVMMPGMDGFALVEAIRVDPALRATPVIILSARASEEEASKGLAAGANDYIAKPFSSRDLLVRVASALATASVVTEQVLLREEVEQALARAEASVGEAKRERERAEALAAELSMTTLRLHTAQRAARVGIFDWDVAAGRLTWSPELYRLMGLDPGAIEATPEAWSEALVQEDREPSWEAFRVAVAERRPSMELEVRLQQPTGAARWVRVNSQVDFDDAGKPARVLGAVVDIQDLKQAAAERARALEEAERTSRAKDEFLATMSHELRTPLNAMLGWASILKDNPRDRKDLERGLAVIERNARAQARLVSDLLDVSRIISGKLLLSITKTDIAAVVHAAADVLRQAADAKGVELAVDAPPDVGTLQADADRLQQVIWNLLSNAIKFTPAGGRISILARRTDSAIVFRVIDTGLGIPAEHLSFIFDRFRQIDGSITREHAGLGLGLAIVRHLVEAHGGTVSVHSDGHGTGATFTVSLPLHAARSPNAERRQRDVGGADGERADGGARAFKALRGRRVLIVEDDPDSCEFLEIVLEAAGASCMGAGSARAALEETTRAAYDAIVSDIGMPEMDGYELMERLRARAGARVPAVALTAYARPEDRARALAAGYQAHLSKPVDPHVLVTTLEQLLPRHG
jgi:PAS domain S-box-containing protein